MHDAPFGYDKYGEAFTERDIRVTMLARAGLDVEEIELRLDTGFGH